MAFFSNGKVKKPKTGEGRVYVFRFVLECGTIVHKVGLCHSNRATDRMMEVLLSFYNAYRYVPMCRLRRDRGYQVPHLVEKHLHELLAELKYKFDKKFSGHTEFFKDVDEELLLDYIDSFKETDLLKDADSMKVKDYETICKTTKKTSDIQTNDELPF